MQLLLVACSARRLGSTTARSARTHPPRTRPGRADAGRHHGALLIPTHTPRHRNKAGCGRVGAQELHREGGELQRHGHRRRRAAEHRQHRDRQARVEAVQPQPRPRAQQGRREGLQDWPPWPPQRAATSGLPQRGGDGAQGHRVPGEARQRGGGGRGVPLVFHAPHPLQDLSKFHAQGKQRGAGEERRRTSALLCSAAGQWAHSRAEQG